MRAPALGDRPFAVVVKTIAAKGEYAGWRATRATGDFDLRTFEVRGYPTPAAAGAAAGDERLRRGSPGARDEAAGPSPAFCSSRRASCAGCGATGWRSSRRRRAADRLALLALTFSHAVIRDLGVGIVDADGSPTSIAYVQSIASSPGVKITTALDDLTGAMQRHPLRRGAWRRSTSRRTSSATSFEQAAADRHLLQPAIFHAGQQCLERV